MRMVIQAMRLVGRQKLRRGGGWLALAGLALQLVLSFGHVHAEDIFGPLGRPMVQGQGPTILSADRRQDPAGSQNPAGDAAAEGACAVCAAMALAGSLVLPDPVKLPLPSGAAEQAAPPGDRLMLRPAPFRLFQSRAPPTV